MEIGEGVKPKTVEIEAPEKLKIRQNFYDQEPFSGILSTKSQSAGIEIQGLRYGISSLTLCFGEYGFTEGDFQKGRSFNINNLRNGLSGSIAKLKLSGDFRENYFTAMREVTIALSDFPRWAEYVSEQRWKSHYKSDGEFVNHKKFISGMPESYGAWINRKYTSSQRQMLLGIEDIFPQGAFQTSVSINGLKENSQSKKWRILKAAEFISPKK